MFQSNVNHYEVVKSALSGNRPVSEQAMASIAVLQERLERVKRYDKIFSRIAFSPSIQKLAKQQDKIPVG